MSATLSDLHTQLLNIALLAQKNAHAPYSHFQVGAALIDDTAQVYNGCNVENAAYPLGQCAEILIASPNDDFCPPCGGCRQKIAEFADKHTLVHLATQQGKIKTVTFSELLPLSFGFKPE